MAQSEGKDRSAHSSNSSATASAAGEDETDNLTSYWSWWVSCMPTASYRDSGACGRGLDAVLDSASFALQCGQSPALKKKKQKKKKASFCRKAPHVVLFHPTRTSVSTAMHCTGKTCYSPRRVRPLGFLQPKGDSGSGRTSFPVTNGVTEGKCKEMQFAYV